MIFTGGGLAPPPHPTLSAPTASRPLIEMLNTPLIIKGYSQGLVIEKGVCKSSDFTQIYGYIPKMF